MEGHFDRQHQLAQEGVAIGAGRCGQAVHERGFHRGELFHRRHRQFLARRSQLYQHGTLIAGMGAAADKAARFKPACHAGKAARRYRDIAPRQIAGRAAIRRTTAHQPCQQAEFVVRKIVLIENLAHACAQPVVDAGNPRRNRADIAVQPRNDIRPFVHQRIDRRVQPLFVAGHLQFGLLGRAG
jgi:hypothetical protein